MYPKPKDTTELVLKFENFLYEEDKIPLGIQTNTSSVINIPFYYEGKIYNEKITLNYTFGKSKLIEYDNPLQMVNDSISKFFIDDNKNDTIIRAYPKTNFIFYYSVKNITGKPIWCTKAMIAWSDVSDIRDVQRRGTSYIIIPPYTTYKIPVQMNMHNRYKFSRSGNFIVFSEDVYEIHKIALKSDFEPERKYKY